MAFSHDDKKGVFDFFVKILKIFDDFVYYENVRGHVSKAPENVRKYVLQKCKGEDLLEYFKRRKNYFIVENNRVALKGKKKIPSRRGDANAHSAPPDKGEEQKSEVIQFNLECPPESTPPPSKEDEERERYENYSIQYFRRYLNRNKKVRVEWIAFNDLPKKVKRFLHNHYNKKVRSFFMSFPTEFTIDEADCVSLRTVSSAVCKQTVEPEQVVKSEKSECGAASSAEVRKIVCLFECITFFVKILHQKQTPYAIDKLGGYLSQAPAHVKDHIKFAHKTFNNFFKHSPKIFQTDVPGKVALAPSHDKVLRSLKELLKEALSDPHDDSLKDAVDSLLQSESFNGRRPENREGTLACKMFEESSLLYVNSTGRIIPEDSFNHNCNKRQKKVDVNQFNIQPKNTDDNVNNDSFRNLDESNMRFKNYDHEAQKESSYKYDIKVSIADNEMINEFSDCLIQNCSVSEGNEEPLLLSENSTKRLIPELKKITVWEDSLYSKTTQSKNESLKENDANVTLKHKTDAYIENVWEDNLYLKTTQSKTESLKENHANMSLKHKTDTYIENHANMSLKHKTDTYIENDANMTLKHKTDAYIKNGTYKNEVNATNKLEDVIKTEDSKERIDEYPEEHLLRESRVNFETSEKYNESQITIKMNLTVNCKESEQNLECTKNTIVLDDIILKSPKEIGDEGSDSANNRVSQEVKMLDCDFSESSNGFAHSIAHISIKEIDKLLQNDEFNIAKLDNQKKSDFTYEGNSIQLSPKSNETKFDSKCKEDELTYLDLLSHESNEFSSSYSDDNLGTSDRTDNLTELSEEIKFLQNNDKPVENKIKIESESNETKIDSKCEEDRLTYLDLLSHESNEFSSSNSDDNLGTSDKTHNLTELSEKIKFLQNKDKPVENKNEIESESNETKFDSKCEEDELTYSDLLSHESNEISSSYPDDNLGTSDRTHNLTEPSEKIKFLQNNDKPLENKNKIENTVTSDFDSLRDTKFEIGWSDSADNDFFNVHNQPGVQEKKFEKNAHSCEFTDSNHFIESVTDNENNQPSQNDELKITIHENIEYEKMFDSGYEEDLCLNVLFDTSNENSCSDDKSETSENAYDFTELYDETDYTHPAVQEKTVPIHKFAKKTGSNDIVDSVNQINRINRLLHYDKQTETENVENSIVDSGHEDFTCLSHKSNENLSSFYDDDRTFNISYHQEKKSNHSTTDSINCGKFKKEFFKNMEMGLISGEKGVDEYDSEAEIRMFVKERSLNVIENKAVTKQAQLIDDNYSFLSAEESPAVENALEPSFNENHFQNEELEISDDSTTLLGIDRKYNTSEIHVIPELSRKQNEFSDDSTTLLAIDRKNNISEIHVIPELSRKQKEFSVDSTTLLGIDKKNNISEIHVIPELSKKQNEFSDGDDKVFLNDLVNVAEAKSLVPKTYPSKCISTDSILKTDSNKTENGDNAPRYSSVGYPLQTIRAEVTLLTSHSCLAQTRIESRLQIIYFVQSVFFCEEHESCLDCFRCLAVGDKVSCYISLSEIPHKIWIAFMVSKEGEHVCYANEDSLKTMSFDLINNQDKSFNLSKECIGMDDRNSRSSTSMPEKDEICNLLETASVQSETLCLNASNLQLSAMQQFSAFKELNNCLINGIVFEKVTDTRECSCQTEAVENRCRQSNPITCQTNDISLTRAEIMCQTDFSSDIKTIKNTTNTYSQTVSTGEIMIMEYYHL
ncbi:repetitive organellar protein [Parasteatoda tepidariorum]|uniref:repetitive organellar protein n=1 Tax=Parasteatoda tepidariorum TaxID=114398 RepID=UPI001C71B3CF|nr:uncharacterized protein LOC122271178 [Parasteatoda tepidariorum]